MLIRHAVAIAAMTLLPLWMAGCDRGVHVAAVPPPPSGTVPEPRAAPARSYAELAGGLLVDSRFKTVTSDHYSVEVRDLLVGPRKTSAPYAFPGATIVLVRAGTGSADLGSRHTDLRSGTAFVIPERVKFTLVNGGDGSLILQAISFTQV